MKMKVSNRRKLDKKVKRVHFKGISLKWKWEQKYGIESHEESKSNDYEG